MVFDVSRRICLPYCICVDRLSDVELILLNATSSGQSWHPLSDIYEGIGIAAHSKLLISVVWSRDKSRHGSASALLELE